MIAYKKGVKKGMVVQDVQVKIDDRWHTQESHVDHGLADIRVAWWRRHGHESRLLIRTGPLSVGKLPGDEK